MQVPALIEAAGERVLDVAGPVPWDYKAPLYERLAEEERWHAAILRSLQFSQTDVYGSIDASAAGLFRAQLKLPPSRS